MSSRRSVRQLLVAVILGVLVGGGLMAITPAGAEVSNAVATNWKKIWKKNLKPLADRRYYTKAQSDTKYQPKGAYDAAGAAAAAQAAATAAANSATDSKLTNYYTKTQGDAKYAPAQPLYRGTFIFGGYAPVASVHFTQSVSYGATFPVAPTRHYIKQGDPAIAACPGTAAAPDAMAGHMCVYEGVVIGTWSTNRGICTATGCAGTTTDTFGAALYAYTNAVGTAEIFGSWAARPSGAIANPARVAPSRVTGSVGSGG